MRLRRQRPTPAPPPEVKIGSDEPEWRDLLDSQERPNREIIAAHHSVFADTLLEPVPLPRWLRGRRRARRDKLTGVPPAGP